MANNQIKRAWLVNKLYHKNKHRREGYLLNAYL
jgi:hypothetical protein